MVRLTRILLLLILFAVAQIGQIIAAVWAVVCIIAGSDRAWRIIVAYDRLANAATGGSDRETISSRAYRGTRENQRGWCLLCRMLDFLQKDHCRNSDGI